MAWSMKHVLLAAVALLSLAACSRSSSAIDPTAALPAVADPSLSSDLYVADQGLDAVVAFDSQGKKVAKVSFGPEPLDVVTDSHGNVYVLTAESVVHKLTHNLSRVIGQYTRKSEYSVSLAIDAEDNLYIQGLGYKGQYIFVARYPYGSSKPDKTYKVPFGGAAVAGISVRGSMLFLATASDTPPWPKTSLYGCSLDASDDCHFLLRSPITPFYGCGFTTTSEYAVYGSGVGGFGNFVDGFHPYTAWQLSKGRKVKLPKKYFLGAKYGFCNLHNYGSFVWGGMKTNGTSKPAEAVEFDMVAKTVHATVGAGVLSIPVAAYDGNGFTP